MLSVSKKSDYERLKRTLAERRRETSREIQVKLREVRADAERKETRSLTRAGFPKPTPSQISRSRSFR